MTKARKARFRLRTVGEIEMAASTLAYGIAVAMLGLLLFVAMNGLGYVTGILHPFGYNLGFYGTSILTMSGVYVVLLYPFYKSKAIWVFGLSAGLIEGIGGIEAGLGFSVAAGSSPGNYAWDVYMGILGVLAVCGAIRLRKAFRPSPLPVFGLLVALAAPHFAVSLPATLSGTYDVLFDLVVLGSVVLLTWRDRTMLLKT